MFASKQALRQAGAQPCRVAHGVRVHNVVRPQHLYVTRRPCLIRAEFQHGPASKDKLVSRIRSVFEQTAKHAMAVTATGLIAVTLAIAPPAMAFVDSKPSTEGLGVSSRNAAAELEDIIRQRTGGELPQAHSSPSVQAVQRKANAILQRAQDEGGISASDKVVLEQLQAELDTARQQLANERARSQEEQKELRRVAEESRAKILELQAQEQALMRAAEEEKRKVADLTKAAALPAKEIIKEVVREVPVEVVKEVVKEVKVPVAGNARVVVKEVPVEVIKEVVKEVPVEVVKEVVREVPASGEASSLGPLNALGIVLAGLVGGFALVQQNSSKSVEAELAQKLESEKGSVEKLKAQAVAAEQAVERERQAVQKLKLEAMSSAEAAARLTDLERKQKEAAERAAELATGALEAEKKLVNAMRNEAAALKEATEAEKAAKFAAQSEADALKRMLEDTEAAMRQERDLARKIGEDAKRAMEELKMKQEQLGSFVIEGQEIKDSLAAETSRAQQAEEAAAKLQRDLADANDTIEQQKDLVQRVGQESLSLKEGMALLKSQAAELAKKAQDDAAAAVAARNALQEEVDAALKALEGGNQQVAALTAEVASTKEALGASQKEVTRLKLELKDSKSFTEKLHQEIRGLQAQVSVTEQHLEAEKSDKAALKEQLVSIKSQYHATSDALEVEQGLVMQLKKESAELQRAVDALRAENKEATSRMVQMQEHLAQQLSDAEQRVQEMVANKSATEQQLLSRVLAAEQEAVETRDQLQQVQESYFQLQSDLERTNSLASEERVGKEAVTDAFLKLQNSVVNMEEDLAQATRDTEATRVQLDAERAAREAAEAIAAQLRSQLETTKVEEGVSRQLAEKEIEELRQTVASYRAMSSGEAVAVGAGAGAAAAGSKGGKRGLKNGNGKGTKVARPSGTQ